MVKRSLFSKLIVLPFIVVLIHSGVMASVHANIDTEPPNTRHIWNDNNPPVVADGDTVILSGFPGVDSAGLQNNPLVIPRNATVYIESEGILDIADNTLIIDIRTNASVIWLAQLTKTGFGGTTLRLRGSGSFEMRSGGSITSTRNSAIAAEAGTTTEIHINGGTLSAHSAIYGPYALLSVEISKGGTVTSTAHNTGFSAVNIGDGVITVADGGEVTHAANGIAIKAAGGLINITGGTVSGIISGNLYITGGTVINNIAPDDLEETEEETLPYEELTPYSEPPVEDFDLYHQDGEIIEDGIIQEDPEVENYQGDTEINDTQEDAEDGNIREDINDEIIPEHAEVEDTSVCIRLVLNQAEYTLNGDERVLDTAPVIINNRAMVPLRCIAEALGAVVNWDRPNRIVIVEHNGAVFEIPVGEPVPGMDTPAIIRHNRVMVPLRFISEALGAEVEWNPGTREIVIVK
jgi:hypothetical protein